MKPGYIQVFVGGAEGGAACQISNGDFTNGSNEFGTTRASRTPDGKYLILFANRHPESDHAYFDAQVYEFSVVDGSLRALTNRVAQVSTSALAMTGEADYRTAISGAEQFYTALKLPKMETVLVRVLQEPQGTCRRPSQNIAKMLYPAGWFDQHKSKN